MTIQQDSPTMFDDRQRTEVYRGSVNPAWRAEAKLHFGPIRERNVARPHGAVDHISPRGDAEAKKGPGPLDFV
jgi:hypothetical protein